MTPVELAQTKRLLLAKQLLTETNMPVVQVALASGFESLRRFNAAFRAHYQLTPSSMRRSVERTASSDVLTLTLAYRPPLAWEPLLYFLKDRSTVGVEHVEDQAYARTVDVDGHRGWLRVTPARAKNALRVELATSLVPALPAVLFRLRNFFDLNARPDVIASHLASDPQISKWVGRCPCLRVPGAFDGFELAVRAILGQRISVKAATNLAGKLAATFGEHIVTPFSPLNRLTPTCGTLANVGTAELRALGISEVRSASIVELARLVSTQSIELKPGSDPVTVMSQLIALHGIGEWTAQYVAMRALRWPDAFPDGDLGLLKAFAENSPRKLRAVAEAWRPWRAYAAAYLWESLRHCKQEKEDD